MMTDKVNYLSHTFMPALQDISLKRFRLRYCTFNDCYYLHWDDAACLPLAKINGLFKGLHSSSGVRRYVDDTTGEVYIGFEKNIKSSHMEWSMDFSTCGLVVKTLQVKATSSLSLDDNLQDPSSDLSFTVSGDDDSVISYPDLGDDYHTDLHEYAGCSKITITANMRTSSNNPLFKFLSSSNISSDSALDVIIELKCPRPKEETYCGEILLGIKFSSEIVCDEINPDSVSDRLIMDCHPREGQLQVHIVEGAGLVDEDTHKAYNTVVKCDLLTETARFSTRQTSPRSNAYPTWTKNFVFNGIMKEELSTAGLEVILHDHHHFSSDHVIGGLRMCVPIKKKEDDGESDAFFSKRGVSPIRARSFSPIQNSSENYPSSDSPEVVSLSSQTDLNIVGADSTIDDKDINLKRIKSRSLPHVSFPNRNHTHPSAIHTLHPTTPTTPSSIIPLRRVQSPSSVPATKISPYSNSGNPRRYSSEFSPNLSPGNSPLMAIKTFFRNSGSHIRSTLTPVSSPRGSPRSSPLLGRRRFKNQNKEEERENEFVHWWMGDVTPGEATHWTQVMEREGKWVYYWHSIRYKLKSVLY